LIEQFLINYIKELSIEFERDGQKRPSLFFGM